MCSRDDDPTTYDLPLLASASDANSTSAGSDGMGTVRPGSMRAADRHPASRAAGGDVPPRPQLRTPVDRWVSTEGRCPNADG